MRMMPAAVVVLLDLALLAAVVPPALAATARCDRPPGATTMKASRAAVVYERRQVIDSLNSRTRFWGCLKSRGKLVRLLDGQTTEYSDNKVNGRFRLQGRFASFIQAQTYRSIGSLSVLVYDLRSGRHVRRHVEGAVSPEQWTVAISHLVLSARGHVAWRQVGPDPFGSPTGVQPQASIVVFDARGRQVLDHAAAASIPRLQRKGGKTLTWTHDGTAKTYDLKNT